MPGAADHRSEVGTIVAVDRRRYGDDVEGAVGELARVGRQLELLGCAELVGRDLHRLVVALLELVDAALADVEADGRELAAKGEGHWQTDVTKADDGNLFLFERTHRVGEQSTIHASATRAG